MQNCRSQVRGISVNFKYSNRLGRIALTDGRRLIDDSLVSALLQIVLAS